jgi:hypothetical protein
MVVQREGVAVLRLIAAGAAAVAALARGLPAAAAAPQVGPLRKEPTATIRTQAGFLTFDVIVTSG